MTGAAGASRPGEEAWQPGREIEIVAGTPPGGGLDRVARALAAALASAGLPGTRVCNVPGDGARKAWSVLDARPGDGHLLAISSPNLITDRLLGQAAFDETSYTPLAILCAEYIGFAVAARSPLHDAAG